MFKIQGFFKRMGWRDWLFTGLLAMVLLFLVSVAANAQAPTYLSPSVLAEQYKQQRDQARAELDETRCIQQRTQDSLTRCRSVLAATRQAYQKLDQMRLNRIDSLVEVANGGIQQEYTLRMTAEARAEKLTDQLGEVRTALMEEELTTRFLGWGRKRALKRIRAMIPTASSD